MLLTTLKNYVKDGYAKLWLENEINLMKVETLISKLKYKEPMKRDFESIYNTEKVKV